MELANYLRNILYNHDVVVIPGLGSFVTKYKQAEIDKSNKTISPPVKYLTFDPSLSISDHLLSQHIAIVKNINLLKAESEVSRLISKLRYKLDNGETIYLEGIGYLSKVDKTIRFEKDEESNFLTGSYGLSTVDFAPLELDLDEHPVIEVVKKGKKRSPVLLILLFIFILIAGGGIYLYISNPGLIKEYISKFTPVIKNSADTITTVHKLTNDTSSKTSGIEKFFESVTDKKNALSLPQIGKDSVTKVKVPSPPPPAAKYYIIAGSFKTTQQAKYLANEIEKDGYKVDIIKFDNSVYRISLGVYTDKNIALRELFKIRELKGDNTVWLLTD